MGVCNGGVDLMVVNVEDSRYLIKMANRFNVPPSVIVAAALECMDMYETFYPDELVETVNRCRDEQEALINED